MQRYFLSVTSSGNYLRYNCKNIHRERKGEKRNEPRLKILKKKKRKESEPLNAVLRDWPTVSIVIQAQPMHTVLAEEVGEATTLAGR